MKTPRNTEPRRIVGVQISGATPDSIKAAQEAINEIVYSPAADVVKRQALQTLDGLCSTKNVAVSNCHIEVGGAK